MRSRSVPFALLLLAAWPSLGDEPSPRPAIRVRLIRPDRQAQRVIALFEGAKATDPAQALAAWKRASAEPKRLGKPLEALIAAINPRMASELRTLDGAEAAIGFAENFTRTNWWAVIPRDDGTFSSLASALVLSGGAEEPPIGNQLVDRLGPPGSALMARSPLGLIVAGSRRDVQSALAQPKPVEGPRDGEPGTGWKIELDSGALMIGAPTPPPLPLRILAASGCRAIEATAGVVGDAFELATTSSLDAAPGRPASRLDPSWLDPIPSDGAVAAAAFALDPAAWDAAFALADRVEKADPARAEVAPTRIRLGLLARALGVRLEADILPHLRGVSAWIGTSSGKDLDRGMIAAHFSDEAAAARVLGRIRPQPPLVADRRGATLLIAWGGDAMRESLEALVHPDRSAGATLRSNWDESLPTRAGGLWPGRVPGLLPASSPLAVALVDAPPIVWTGEIAGAVLRDRVRWGGLDATIRRFLDLIPLDPPPDR